MELFIKQKVALRNKTKSFIGTVLLTMISTYGFAQTTDLSLITGEWVCTQEIKNNHVLIQSIDQYYENGTYFSDSKIQFGNDQKTIHTTMKTKSAWALDENQALVFSKTKLLKVDSDDKNYEKALKKEYEQYPNAVAKILELSKNKMTLEVTKPFKVAEPIECAKK